MLITGLENNYYLAGNDIWLQVGSFLEPVLKLEIVYTNLSTSQTLKKLVLYPRPENNFIFNCSEPVRALFPEPNHLANNNLQQIVIAFTAFYVDENTPNDAQSVQRYFIRGYRKKAAQNEWYLSASEELIIKPWPQWWGITLPGFAQRIQGASITEYVPTDTKTIRPKDCDYKIIKFLNSLGGYQYFLFESWEIKEKVKSVGDRKQVQLRLRDDNFRSLGLKTEEEIILKTSTPFDLQNIALDLMRSSEVYMYDQNGNDNQSRWIRLQPESNDSVKNNKDLSYDNELTYNIINSVNFWL